MRRVERICAYWIAAMVTSTVAMLASGQQQQTSAQTAQSPVLPEVTLQVLPQRVSAPGPLLPEDPFQRCAVRALRGDFGPLERWQRNAYAWGLAQGVTIQGVATVTTYYPQEGHKRGDEMRSGVGVNERYAAVLQREWWRYRRYYVWVQPTQNVCGQWVGGIRQVMDTGANSNHRNFAVKYGADRWLDYWYPEPVELVKRAGYCFIETD